MTEYILESSHTYVFTSSFSPTGLTAKFFTELLETKFSQSILTKKERHNKGKKESE
jgi:hypothetical protein